MAANVAVNFDILQTTHPNYAQIKSMVGGSLLANIVAGNWETCCVQVSYALNHSGEVIDNYDYWNAEMGRKVRAVKSSDQMNYIYEVSDMKTYLNNVYGVAENYKGSKADMISKISGRQGIIAFGHRHMDLWVKDHFHWQKLYLDLWGFEETKLRGIFFWEVTSQWGF